MKLLRLKWRLAVGPPELPWLAFRAQEAEVERRGFMLLQKCGVYITLERLHRADAGFGCPPSGRQTGKSPGRGHVEESEGGGGKADL